MEDRTINDMNTMTIATEERYPVVNAPEVLIADMEEFSALTRTALTKIGLVTAKDLLHLSLNDLQRIDLVGKVGRNAIIKYFQDNGLSFSKKSYFQSRADDCGRIAIMPYITGTGMNNRPGY